MQTAYEATPIIYLIEQFLDNLGSFIFIALISGCKFKIDKRTLLHILGLVIILFVWDMVILDSMKSTLRSVVIMILAAATYTRILRFSFAKGAVIMALHFLLVCLCELILLPLIDIIPGINQFSILSYYDWVYLSYLVVLYLYVFIVYKFKIVIFRLERLAW
ncbi:hypothetical protein EZV73_22110 [Acidaminobacter sp. JC074]|uniref:hypothetical protein n=1 Tax=Acidaminobacter sp. JC074 TaxID=2530199 RepID=UPI001F10004E|nr:hypothetical protein [Acidaminobacter sp. JC074]MCH4890293.1 hypothetical protein [Acidaminobacter sp. JC074]